MSRKISSTVLIILVFIVVTQITAGISVGQDIDPSDIFVLLQYIVLVCLICHWIRKDSRIHGVNWFFDWGFFLCFAWPLIVPIYLLKTRKAKAFLILLGWLGIYVGSVFAGILLSVFFLPMNYRL